MRRGGAFYDLPGVLERYREARPAGVSVPNLVMEEPALLEVLGSVEGLRVIEDFAAPPGAFDLVVSRMALHYVEDIGRVLSACHACLSPGGRIVFTVVHPVITSHDARPSTDELRANWVVDDYFAGGPRDLDWLGAAVVWHHRTIEAHVGALQGAGFVLEALRECPPTRERFGCDEAEYARRSRIPMFLLLAGARR